MQKIEVYLNKEALQSTAHRRSYWFIDGASPSINMRETTRSGSAFQLRDYQQEAAQKWYREGSS